MRPHSDHLHKRPMPGSSNTAFVYTLVPEDCAGNMAISLLEAYRVAFEAAARRAAEEQRRVSAAAWN